MQLGLTPEQIAQRRLGIGGSDAAKIVNGEWYDLWLDKTNRKPPDDLSRVLPVQMGNATEEFNAYWYALTKGHRVICRGERRIDKDYHFLCCTLDGIALVGTDDPTFTEAVWQAKHVNAFSKIEDVVARYTPQVTHEMIVCGLSHAVLSVFIGTDKYEAVDIELDEFFAAQYVDKCVAFWDHVTRDVAPEQGAPLPVPPPVMPVNYRAFDLDLLAKAGAPLPNWAPLIQPEMTAWLENKKAADKHAAAAKKIKALLPDDVSPCTFGGVTLKRDARGLAIKESK